MSKAFKEFESALGALVQAMAGVAAEELVKKAGAARAETADAAWQLFDTDAVPGRLLKVMTGDQLRSAAFSSVVSEQVRITLAEGWMLNPIIWWSADPKEREFNENREKIADAARYLWMTLPAPFFGTFTNHEKLVGWAEVWQQRNQYTAKIADAAQWLWAHRGQHQPYYMGASSQELLDLCDVARDAWTEPKPAEHKLTIHALFQELRGGIAGTVVCVNFYNEKGEPVFQASKSGKVGPVPGGSPYVYSFDVPCEYAYTTFSCVGQCNVALERVK